jgi:heat shock protein HtpX
MLLQACLSRRREALADASAVQFTRDPGGLRRALEKMAASPIPTCAINAANAALWFDCPQRLQRRPWLDRLLATHPPIERRIAWLRALEGTA